MPRKANLQDVPDYMYLNTPMSPKAPGAQQEDEPYIGGCASADIREMLNAELSDRIKIVIQTGGSMAWDLNTMDQHPGQGQPSRHQSGMHLRA